MITLSAAAHCNGCTWTTGPATSAEVDRAAEKHTRGAPGHPTVVIYTPAGTS